MVMNRAPAGSERSRCHTIGQGDGAVPPGWKESFGSIVNTMPV